MEARNAGRLTRSISCRAVTWLCMLDGWKLLFRATSSNSLRKMLMLMCASHLRPAHSARSAFSYLGLRDWPTLKRRKEPKAKKSLAETLARDLQGTAAEKLAIFEKLQAQGAFEGVDRRELIKLENMLRTFAAMEMD